jgi:hypothetical protein
MFFISYNIEGQLPPFLLNPKATASVRNSTVANINFESAREILNVQVKTKSGNCATYLVFFLNQK